MFVFFDKRRKSLGQIHRNSGVNIIKKEFNSEPI